MPAGLVSGNSSPVHHCAGLGFDNYLGIGAGAGAEPEPVAGRPRAMLM